MAICKQLRLLLFIVATSSFVLSQDILGPLPRPCEFPFNVYDFCDTSLARESRVADLIGRLTIEEKAGLMSTFAVLPAFPVTRLGIPAYSWWSEALHGAATTCVTNVVDGVEVQRCPSSFPAALNNAATFNEPLWRQMTSFISDEIRAMTHFGALVVYFIGDVNDVVPLPIGRLGLNVWSPNINIFRDPRWGRGQETPGEDPILTGRYATQYVKGMQEGDDQRFIKVGANLKHFHTYSLENYNGTDRHSFNAIVSEQDLQQTYYPHFQYGVENSHPLGMMCSYNRINGVPGCAHQALNIARESWGFDGYITGDCGAITDFVTGHNFTDTYEEATAVGIQAGCDLDCGRVYRLYLEASVEQGLIDIDTVDESLSNLMMSLMKVGWFDPVEDQVYENIPFEVIDSAPHRDLARRLAKESMVLLKNNNNILPIQLSNISSIAIIGPHLNSTKSLCSNYHGVLPHIVSPLEGIVNAVEDGNFDVEINYAFGCEIDDDDISGIDEAVSIAAAADVAVLFVGINEEIEREGLDRVGISLSGVQDLLVQRVLEVQQNTVVVLIHGGAVAIEFIAENVPGIIDAFYPGEEGGNGIADVLFGSYSPSGKMPYTVYPSNFITRSFFDMDMRSGNGLTYRFYNGGDELFKFGDGLSFTEFRYSVALDDTGFFTVNVTNVGDRNSDVSLLAFLRLVEPILNNDCPLSQLVDFTKEFDVFPQETRSWRIFVDPIQANCYDVNGNRYLANGYFEFRVGDATTYFTVGSRPQNAITIE